MTPLKTIPTLLKYYAMGCACTMFFILVIHLYSYCFEPYFRYAEWHNLLLTTLICGIPFGIAIWAFLNVLKKEL